MKPKYQLIEELDKGRAQIAAMFSEHQKDGAYTFTPEQVAEVNRRNDELESLQKALDDILRLEAIEGAVKQDGRRTPEREPAGTTPAAAKDMIAQLQEDPAYKAWAKGQGRSFGAVLKQDMRTWALKTLISTTAGFAAPNNRTDRVVDSAQEMPTVASLIPQTNTTASIIKWMLETTYTNNAAAVAEGALKPEAALAWTEQTSPVEKIAVTVPVTDEQLADIPQMRSLIERRLLLMLLQAEDNLLLNGTGLSPQIRGFLNTPGIQTQAKGADPVPDAILKAITLIRINAQASPSGLVIHPSDWQDIRLLKTTDGVYIWGAPSEIGPARIWGLEPVTTTAIAQNTALVGDFATYSEIFRREDVRVDLGYVDDQFIRNQQTIRMEERLALVVYRPAAFSTVTGI